MQKRRSARGYGGPTTSPLPILITVLIVFAALIAAGLYVVSAQSVVVSMDDQRVTTRTHQTNVRALLSEAGVYLEKEDVVSPGLDSPIRAGMIISVAKAHPVLIEIDGQTQRVLTHKTAPQDILAENNITLAEHDIFDTDDPATPRYIRVVRARTIKLIDNTQSRDLLTAARTVGEALAEAKIALYVADSVMPDPSMALSDDTTITIERSTPITIRVDGRTLVTRTHGKTISAALAESGIALVGLDSSDPLPDQPIKPEMTIHVTRVSEADEVQRTELPFKHITQSDSTLDLDMRRVIQAGQAGVQEVHVRVRREDGVEVSRSAPQSWAVQPPHDEIDAIGTRVTIKTLETPNGTLHYWRVIKMRAASYKPSSTGTAAVDPLYGITASGQKLRKGIVAVDPALIPLGTPLYIPNYGEAVAGDTGGGVKGRVIDLGYSDNDYQEWSGSVDVYLLAPAPAQIPPLPEEQP